MSAIAYITNAAAQSGVGHRATAVLERLQKQYQSQIQPTQYQINGEDGVVLQNDRELISAQPWPGALGSKSIQWIRLGRALSRVMENESYGLYHATNQTLSFLAGKLRPSVVTVHDVIEITDPQDRKAHWINRYLYSGIARADKLIAVSEYTASAIEQRYGISREHIAVVPNGVGAAFRPIENFRQTIGYQQLLKKLSLPTKPGPVVLYVGSDHPRKNVPTALKAFASLHAKDNTAVFVKVGRAGIERGRAELLSTARKLNITDAMRIYDDPVSDEGLNELYNLADVFIFPSRYEGFGLPPLQAMAAGLPVVTTNATSIPEVVGSAALQYDPDDITGMSEGLELIVEDREKAEQLRAEGRERATIFSWDDSVEKIVRIYQELL